MADNTNGQNNQQQYSSNRDALADVLGKTSYTDMRNAVAQGVQDALKAERQLNPKNVSQSTFRDRQNEMAYGPNARARASQDYRRTGNAFDDFETGLKDGFKDVFAGGDFKKSVNGALSEFSKEFGFELKDLSHEMGKELGKQFANSKLGKALTDKIQKAGTKLINGMFDPKNADQKAARDALNKVWGKFIGKAGEGASAASSAMSNAGASSAAGAAGKAGATAAAGSMSGAGSALSGAISALSKAVPLLLVLIVVLKAVSPLISGIAAKISAFGKAFTREEDTRKQRLKNAQERMQKDLEYLAREPFEILKKAAEDWQNTWDANLAKVSLTQGYTKENTYAYYSGVAERLNQEGYGSSIAATSVINNLSSVLESGLSGKVAEEFAYQATKLSALIPTENFVQYASTYSELAAQIIAQGGSQEEALAYANSQLELFASNLLYSSRTLTGGFTTGLKDASSLFANAVEIAQSAKTNNAADISGTLTAVSAVVGEIAPDLANGLVQNVVNAAIGGNSDTIVALRSLAGVNAGNTAFLQALAKDPKGIFVSLFSNLANLQNMSPDNYMEVAEGLSSVFGVDMKAFARVDFNTLANAIQEMSVNNLSLAENMALLQSGEATTTAEQLKLQEINNIITEQGLAYVIDSEAGRAIQQHMWDEQIANELKENEYAVSLQGAALQFLEGIRGAVANVINLLNPIGWIAQGVSKLEATQAESAGKTANLADILERGAVGSNAAAFRNLTSQNAGNLNLVKPLIEMMGGKNNVQYSTSGFASGFTKFGQIAGYITPVGLMQAAADYVGQGDNLTTGAGWNAAWDRLGGSGNYGTAKNLGANLTKAVSKYAGFTGVGKSALSVLNSSQAKVLATAVRASSAATASANADADTVRRVQAWLDSAPEAAKSMTADAWVKTAKKFGISDVNSALSTAGLSMESARSYFDANQGKEGALKEQARKEDEEKFWNQNRKFWDYENGASGIYQTAVWNPFIAEFAKAFGVGGTFDTHFNLAHEALAKIQANQEFISSQIGDTSHTTLINELVKLNTNFHTTFMEDGSKYVTCMQAWYEYIERVGKYKDSVATAEAWGTVSRAEGTKQTEALLALANVMTEFTAEQLAEMDPQMQANALLGKIVIILEAMMQLQNTKAGGLSLIDTMSALGLGVTKQG
jgi:hypothetical protein